MNLFFFDFESFCIFLHSCATRNYFMSTVNNILKTNNLKKKKKKDFLIWIIFSLILNFLHLFFTAVQLQNYFYVHCQSYDRNLLIWTYTRNIIIYLQIIYPCIFNQSINPVSFILTSPSYNFDISFLSRLRCSYSRTSPPPTVDIKVLYASVSCNVVCD